MTLAPRGPSTASRVGRRLGESRGSASYHLRILARAGLIAEDEELGTRRERRWRRPEEPMVGVAQGDPEGRMLDQRLLAVFFARDEEVRSRVLLGGASDDWQEASLTSGQLRTGSWPASAP